MKYNEFIFKSWRFDESQKTLTLNYSLDNQLDFTETYHFDFEFSPDFNKDLLDVTCQSLFLMAGVSYYKTYLPPHIKLSQGQLDREKAEFFERTYQNGLGEFFYR